MKTPLLVPENLYGKTLKVVTRDYGDGSSGPYLPLLGKVYDDTTPIVVIIKDLVTALGGTYNQGMTLSSDNS